MAELSPSSCIALHCIIPDPAEAEGEVSQTETEGPVDAADWVRHGAFHHQLGAPAESPRHVSYW